ncbi:MAG: hypothetical protein A4E58_01045 [Syntrophorhabdus sp. PtaB.Bin006]|nr:MAG: hypothetical protein A4E58_01045 [Syntrophorhabdus sp. PtaB.Bin006]
MPALGLPSFLAQKEARAYCSCCAPLTLSPMPGIRVEAGQQRLRSMDGLLSKCGSRRNTISLPASLRASYPLEARITLNFANSAGHIRPQTCELSFRTFILAQVGPKRARRRDSRKVLPALCLDLAVKFSLSNRRRFSNTAGLQETGLFLDFDQNRMSFLSSQFNKDLQTVGKSRRIRHSFSSQNGA